MVVLYSGQALRFDRIEQVTIFEERHPGIMSR